MKTFNAIWLRQAMRLVMSGNVISPHGRETRELLHEYVTVDMRHPVLTIPQRKLSYQFMAAEAYWILSGDNTVAGIAPFNKNISKFSDDGEKFFGAYGPKIVDQLPYVIEKLSEDQFSRQAGLTIWREKPPETKDVPCTISIFFSIRDNLLHAHANMRSSDVWLGLPYDVFNFSMLGHLVCCRLNSRTDQIIEPGHITITMTSSHVYTDNIDDVYAIFTAMEKNSDVINYEQPSTPADFYTFESVLLSWLKELRHSHPGSLQRWWE